MMTVKTECNKPLNGLCKNILFGSLVAMALIAVTGCTGTETGTKSAKCGEGKCGANQKTSKCGGDKKCSADKKEMKCGEGKCGEDKKTMKCGEGKCGGDKK